MTLPTKLASLLLAVALWPLSGTRSQAAVSESVLYDFNLLSADLGFNTGGATPACTLIQGSDGNFYGTAQNGGLANQGTVFQLTPAGVFTTLHDFSAVNLANVNADGSQPSAGVVEGGDGYFYGTTVSGGGGAAGTVFRVSSGGAFTTLYDFSPLDANGNNSDGYNPLGALLPAADGSFYGTTYAGGINADGTSANGTIFQITAAGALTTLHRFTGLTMPSANADGANPYAALTLGRDGNLYGTTLNGGTGGAGTVFQLTPAGAFATLYSFSAADGDFVNGDGANPYGSLVQGGDGNFYGTTAYGGAAGSGTVFQLTPAGVLATLHAFGAVNSNDANADGAFPFAGLAQGRDGNFYGTASGGGTHGRGTLFVVTPAGVLAPAYDFNITAGATPEGALLLGSDGKYYGTTYGGGFNGEGVVFKAAITASVFDAPSITSAASAAATVGQPFTYQITATNGATAFAIIGLAPGLSLDAATGLISGTPTVSDEYNAILSASNGAGTGAAPLDLTISPAPLTIVSVVAGGDGLAIRGGAKGRFLVQRIGDVSAAVTVAYAVKGDAAAGTDFKALPGTVTIPAGASQAKIKVKALEGATPGGTCKLKLKLLSPADGSYLVGDPVAAKVKIIDPD